MIDYAKTKENCRLYKHAAIARECDVTPPLVSMFLAGKLRYLNGEKAQRIIGLLRQHNLLVEVADEQDVAA